MVQDVPFMQRWPKDFWTSNSVVWLSTRDPPAHLEYNALIDVMWMNGGRVLDDDQLIAASIRVPLEHWLKRRASVLEIVTQVHDDNGVVYLTHHRVAAELEEARSKVTAKRDVMAANRAKIGRKPSKARRRAQKPIEPELTPETDVSDSDQEQMPSLVLETDGITAEQSRTEQNKEPYSETLESVSTSYVATSKPKAEPNQRVGMSLSDIARRAR